MRNIKLSSSEITMLIRQLATIQSTGIPLTQGLNIISENTNNKYSTKLIQTIRRDIEAGHTLSKACKNHPKTFDQITLRLIEAGELSGTLDIVLNKLANYKEKVESLKRKVAKTMYYPVSVIVISIIVVYVFMSQILPSFQSLFRELDANLPPFTQAILNIFTWLQVYWLMFISMSIIFIWLIMKLSLRYSLTKYYIDKLVLSLPIFGKIIHKTMIARFAYTLAVTFNAGLPLPEALSSVAKSSDNSLYFNAVAYVKNQINSGYPMHIAMTKTRFFPKLTTQLICIGETSGTLEQMLTKIAQLYEEEIIYLVDGLSSLLEPLIMVILGSLVGGLIIAMYLPLFEIGTVL